MVDWQTQYDAFLKSEFGKHVMKELQAMVDDNTRQASSMPTAETAYGLIKEAGGVIKTIDHFNTGSTKF